CIGCRSAPEVRREDVHAVLEETESKVHHDAVRERVVETQRKTVVANLRGAAQRHKLLTSSGAEGGRAVAAEVGEAVTPENIQFVAQTIVYANIERIVVEKLTAARNVVVARSVVSAGSIGAWQQLQEVESLLRLPAHRYSIPGKLQVGKRIKYVDAVSAKIPAARRNCG